MFKRIIEADQVQKHDIQANWDKTPDYVPCKAEFIVYDIDENNTKERFKIGDGVTRLGDLAFCESGVGQTTSEGGEIFNDYKNNKAIGEFSSTSGTLNIAGGKGFSILALGYENGTDASNGYALDISNTTGIETGDKFSLYSSKLNKNYDFCGTVTWVEGSGSTLLFVTGFPDGLLPLDGTTTEYIWFPEKPNLNGDVDLGTAAHAEGYNTKAIMIGAHTEGYNTIAAGKYAHAEGNSTIATYGSHSEGRDTQALGNLSHAEGGGSTASGNHSHAEGHNTTASGENSHSEGLNSLAEGIYAHAEGNSTKSLGNATHAEGSATTASGDWSHSEGKQTQAIGRHSHAEGDGSIASGGTSHAEGYNTKAEGYNTHAEGQNTKATGEASHAEGYKTTANGFHSHAEGSETLASGTNSHAEGSNTRAIKNNSHAEGYKTTADGYHSHAEGGGTNLKETITSSTDLSGVISAFTTSPFSYVKGNYAHGEGFNTIAWGGNSHAEGHQTIASGSQSHSEGYLSKATGGNSHAEGYNTTASGAQSHAGGSSAVASGIASFSQGIKTIASAEAQTTIGKYNVENNNALFIIGNGTGDNNRKNAFVVNADGTATIQVSGINDNNVVNYKQLKDYVAKNGGNKWEKELNSLFNDGKLSLSSFNYDPELRIYDGCGTTILMGTNIIMDNPFNNDSSISIMGASQWTSGDVEHNFEAYYDDTGRILKITNSGIKYGYAFSSKNNLQYPDIFKTITWDRLFAAIEKIENLVDVSTNGQ